MYYIRDAYIELVICSMAEAHMRKGMDVRTMSMEIF